MNRTELRDRWTQVPVRWRVTTATLASFVVSLMLGWTADGVADYWFRGEPFDWLAWVSLILLAVAALSLVVFISGGSPTRETGRLLKILLAVVLLPASLGWFQDGIADREAIQGTIGLVGMILAGWLAVRGVVAALESPPERTVAEYQKFPKEKLQRAKILIATSSPLGPTDYPKALLHTLRSMPNLERVISVNDGGAGATGVADHWALLRSHTGPSDLPGGIKDVVLGPAHEFPPETILTEAKDTIQSLVAGESEVVVDVTGGSVPQTLALYDIARELGFATLYVVAKDPRKLAAVWSQSAPTSDDDVRRRLAVPSPADEKEIALDFAQLSRRADESEE